MNARIQRREAARSHIEAWQQSGLTITAYCQHHGLTRSASGNWRRRYSMPPANSAATFVPLQLSAESKPAPGAGIILRSGEWQLSLPAETSPLWLAELLRGLA